MNIAHKAPPLPTLAVAALFLVGCHPPRPAASAASATAFAGAAADRVAQIGDASISAAQFRHLLQARAAGDPQRFGSLPAKEALLDELVVREASYQKALAAGFDRRPDIADAVKRLITEKFQLEQRDADADLLPKAIPAAQISNYYQSHPDEFAEPPAVRGAAIFIRIPPGADSVHRETLLAKAQSLLDKARTATPPQFAILAQENSDDQASRYRSGDTGWISPTRKGVDPGLADALLALRSTGDFAPLISVKNGVWIAKLTDSRPSSLRPLAQVRELISYKLTQERNTRLEQTFDARMKSGLAISINKPLLDSITAPSLPAPPPPPAMISSLVQTQ